MFLQESVESLYAPMGCIKYPIDQIIENDYEVMNMVDVPVPNPVKLESSNIISNEACCQANIVKHEVVDSDDDKYGKLIYNEIKPKDTYVCKDQQLGEALGKLISQQTSESEEPVYAYIEEKAFPKKNTTVDVHNQNAIYENVQEMKANNSEVFQTPMNEDSTIKIPEKDETKAQSFPICRTAARKMFYKANSVIKVLDSVKEFDEEENDDDPDKPVTLKTEVNPDELDGRLMEMQEIVDRMRNVTPPPPEILDPNSLCSVVATTPRQAIPDDHIANSRNTLTDILNARNIGRNQDNLTACLLNTVIVLAIFLFLLGIGLIMYSVWQKW